jgi:DNA-binding transcriptional LysR family regulator
MQLDWLRTFVAVVDHQGFSAASDAIYRSQSRVSAHVAALEKELGAVLIDRQLRPVELTDYGRAFIASARRILEELEAGQTAVDAVDGLMTGSVTLGTYPSAGATFVPSVLRAAVDEFPDVHIGLAERATWALDDGLVSGGVDLSLRPLRPVSRFPDLRHRVLWRERLQVVAPLDHPLAETDEPVPLAAIGGDSLIVTGNDFKHDSEPYAALVERGVDPRVVHCSDQPQTLVELVRSGLGLGLTNELALRIAHTDGVHLREVADPHMLRHVGVFWSGQRQPSRATQAMLDLIMRVPLPDGVLDVRRRLDAVAPPQTGAPTG